MEQPARIEKSAFGSTGHISTRVLFGAAALSEVSEGDAVRTLAVLSEYGVNHIDVASSYGDGIAESRVAPWLAENREGFFLATKVKKRRKNAAREEFLGSLERLGVESVDLLQLHNLIQPEEWEEALGPGGALEALVELRDEGRIRFIGITGHGMSAPRTHLDALKRFPFDSVLVPYNWLLSQDDDYRRAFSALAEECSRRGIALQTIKSLARRPWPEERKAGTWYQPLTDPAHIDLAIRWILSHPGLFVNSVGDIDVLPLALEAASRYADGPPARPSEDQMQTMAEKTDMELIFDGRTALMK